MFPIHNTIYHVKLYDPAKKQQLKQKTTLFHGWQAVGIQYFEHCSLCGRLWEYINVTQRINEAL